MAIPPIWLRESFMRKSLYRLGRYHFAADEIDFRPQATAPRCRVLCCCPGKFIKACTNPLSQSNRTKSFLALNHDDQLNQQYSALVTVLESEAKNAAAATTSARKDAGDYLNAVTIPDMPKWKKIPAQYPYSFAMVKMLLAIVPNLKNRSGKPSMTGMIRPMARLDLFSYQIKLTQK